MKLINYLLIALVFVSSCKEDNEPAPTFAKDYGDGMYIVTENGVSFYDGEVVKNQIYKEVNGATLSNPKKIKLLYFIFIGSIIIFRRFYTIVILVTIKKKSEPYRLRVFVFF